jgi:hypothetical protein
MGIFLFLNYQVYDIMMAIKHILDRCAMTRLDSNTIKAACRQLEKHKIFTISDLAALLKCSIPNARLKLRQWQTYTSYNQNGRYYALPQVPRFDRHGLWRYENAAFSKHGNLKQTIVYLIASAPAGLSGKQLGDLLQLSPQSFLHHFRNCPGTRREKHDGVYVYFAEDPSVYEKQVRERRAVVSRPSVVTLSDAEAVTILVAIINHHGIGAEQIMALPEIKKSKMKPKAIQGFLEYHGLEKKTPDSSP